MQDIGGPKSTDPRHEVAVEFQTRSRPLRCFLQADGAAENLKRALKHEFDTWRNPPKADPATYRQKCHETLGLLLLNLITTHWSDPDMWVQVQANKDWYSHNRFWIPSFLTKDTVRACRRFLVEAGYAREVVGTPAPTAGYRRSTAIKGTSKLMGRVDELGMVREDIRRSLTHDLIHLKSRKDNRGTRRRVQLPADPELPTMLDNLNLINSNLQTAHIDIKLTPDEERRMMEQIIAKAERSEPGSFASELMLDRTQTVLYRVFNNGSLDEGGRFYGGWWQSVPKAHRKHIMIDGKRTVELDYSAMHPTILSHRLGVTVPKSFYEIGIGTKELVKPTFNALLNASGLRINPVDGFDEDVVGLPWREFLLAVRDHFSPYASFFGTGEGLRLQRIDADIAEAVMLHFTRQGITVLPVHDSFLCTEGMEAELAVVMEAEFKRQIGGTIQLSEKRLGFIAREEVKVELQADPDAYEQYFSRKPAN